MNRIRRRRLLKKLRANVRALGHPEANKMSDEQLEALALRFGTLEQVVAISDPAAKMALDFARTMSQVERTLSREDVKVQADEVRKLPEPPRPSGATHDDAGELILLRGGPMDGYLVRDGAPVLFPGWSKDGMYSRSDPPNHDEDGTELATWQAP